MTSAQMTALGISLGIVFAAYKFGPAAVKPAAYAVGAVIIAKQIPYIQNSLA